MKCQYCNNDFKDILCHLNKSKKCQSVHDMDAIRESRKQAKLEKWRCYNKKYYKKNREKIRKNKAENYQKSKGNRFQHKRFRKHFRREHALAYVTSQQEHLFHHSQGVCQPETMENLNHCIEYSNGNCLFCKKDTTVKIIGVNRVVCLACNKAHCYVCETEVDADPYCGLLHYSPDEGRLLGFLPGYCPLYTKDRYYKDLWSTNTIRSNEYENVTDCQICLEIKKEYPEYDIFLKTKKEMLKYPGCIKFTPEFYSCNLCKTEKDFVCQFDLHLRNHTKYGQSIAILGLNVEIDEASDPYLGHVNIENFMMIEDVIMETKGVAAVLTVFAKDTLKHCGLIPKNVDDAKVNLGAAILVKSGADIKSELSIMFKKQRKRQLLKHLVIYEVKNHFQETYSSYEIDSRRSEISPSLLGVHRTSFVELEGTNLCKRNMAILENRFDLILLYILIDA